MANWASVRAGRRRLKESRRRGLRSGEDVGLAIAAALDDPGK
jgi:hypothetical protein